MNILKKLVSFALTAAVVAGIGSTSFAAETSVNIAKTFPDKNLQKVVSKYDKDKNGTLSLAEMKKFTELSIWSEDCVEDLTGIDKLKYTTRLIVFEGDMETINLSKCDNIESLDDGHSHDITRGHVIIPTGRKAGMDVKVVV